MSPPEELVVFASGLPGVRASVVSPKYATGWHWVDLRVHGDHVCIVWREATGFGVSLPTDDNAPFDRVDLDAPGWRRANGAVQALLLALCLLLRQDGDPSP